MSNYDSRIYKNLGTILVIQLVFNLLSAIFVTLYPFLHNYLINRKGYTIHVYSLILSTIASFLGFISFIVMIFWILHLSKLYRVSGDSSVESARNLFLGGLIAQAISFLLNIVGFLLHSISEVIYFIGVQYLPYLVINFIYIFAWVKLSNHFKTTLVSKNGKYGCILIILSIIPSILNQLVYILLTLLYGPIYNWGNSVIYAILLVLLTGVAYLGIILELVGYILVIGVFNNANTPRSLMTPISPDGFVRNNITPGEPTLNNPRYCTNCGAPTVPGADFCNNCGNTM